MTEAKEPKNEQKRYDPHEAEARLQLWWEKEGTYKFDPKSDKKIYSIDVPPPTVSGAMHIGHAFSYSQMDFIARYKRMRGFNLFYPFGTDDNGLATERLIEKIKKIRHQDMDRADFVKLCLDTLENELRPEYIADWKRIGVSADYDIFYTTIDKHSQKISQKAFVDLYKAGRIQQKEAPTLWCPKCHMALAQVELEDKDVESTFNDIVFKLEDGSDLIIATTRPELLPSCAAIFVNPTDKKNAHLIGKTATVPLFNHKVRIIGDKRADPEKGTGVVMCCTFGDQTDIEWYKAHNLEMKFSITTNGKMSELTGEFKGLPIKEGRAAIIKKLDEEGLLKSQKPITHTLNVHERCSTDIEIMHTKQWFVKYLDLKDQFLKAGADLNWFPAHMINRLENWIKGLQWDWCISRQRFFGVPIPVWYCAKCSEPAFPSDAQLPVDPLKDKPEGKCACGSTDFEPETDVLDTWFTSSHTPQIAASLFPEQYDKIYPMSLRPQAHDIITFWLFNTMVKAQLLEKKNPWTDVTISGWALDPKGRKMSKSKGNVIAPQAMIEKYSADALRFWAGGSSLGEDLSFQEKDLMTGQKFSNKMWNASKFVSMHLEDYKGKEGALRAVDKALLSEMNRLIKECTASFDRYEYSKNKLEVEKFFWHVFCDDYLEIVKDRLYKPEKYGKGEREGAQYTLYTVFLTCLKMIAPIMPHITEEIYQNLFVEREKTTSIHNATWPEPQKEWENAEAEETGNLLREIVTAVRQYKSNNSISLGAEIKTLHIEPKDKETQVMEILEDLKGATRAKEVKLEKSTGEPIADNLPVGLWIESLEAIN